jgi:ribonucleoside-diphosphate reductase alpha chain
MHVVKRNGTKEEANLNKIVKSMTKVAVGLNVDPFTIATKVIGGLYDGATTQQIDELSIDKALWLTNEEPDHSKFCARILMNVINKEVQNQEIQSFSQCIAASHSVDLVSAEVAAFVKKNARKLNASIDSSLDDKYEYFGLKTVYDRYLLKHPETRKVLESPQYFLMRVAAGIYTGDVQETIAFYTILAQHKYFTSTPTLFNSGTMHTQMSSCYLLPSPDDDLDAIYDGYKAVGLLSKWAGGIGLPFSRVRSTDSLIKGTNGLSNGIIPFIHAQDALVNAVNQGGKRKGAAAVYLETWHGDLIQFLELRDNTGDPKRRAHDLNLANWVPDLFMRRVEAKGDWSLFSTVDPEVMALNDLWGDRFDVAYEALEAKYEAMEKKPKWYKRIPAQTIWFRMMKTLCETGNGWMNFKDRSNALCNQVTETNGHTVHSSNLCTEILEVTDKDNIAVCNLGSIVLSAYINADRTVNWADLAVVVRQAMRGLDRVIDKNFYPRHEAKNSNHAWRPVGLGVMGTQEMLHKMDLVFDDPETLQLVNDVHGFIYYHAMKASVEMAKEFGPFPNFKISRLAEGKLQFDLQDELLGKGEFAPPVIGDMNWEQLREDIRTHGTRNSLCIAIAPTATIASIVGVGECTEPTISNLFSRQTLSGEFTQVSAELVRDLKAIGMWTAEVRAQIIAADGSVQNIRGIPDRLARKHRTVWEYSMMPIMTLAAVRGRYIDQSQSLNLFMENCTIGKASSMYMKAWKLGLKTTYYLRSRAGTRVEKLVSGAVDAVPTPKKEYTDDEIIVCSLENPESCESCQ